MVYNSLNEKLFDNMAWGAGLGYRYYTQVGPVRVDVGVPLDSIPDNKAWQLYISIGQSF